MHALANLWMSFFGDQRTPDERRLELLHSIRMQNKTTRLPFVTISESSQSSTSTIKIGGEFRVFVANKKEWEATCGDYPPRATFINLIYDTTVKHHIGTSIITDEVVMVYARNHINEEGLPDSSFFDMFANEDFLLVYIHPLHFGDRIEIFEDGGARLDGALNKTRDPFAVFDPSCRIDPEVDPQTQQRDYEILTPLPAAVRVAYNKECTRLGRTTIK